MALYKGTSAQQPQMFGIPGGMYISPQQHVPPQQHQMIPNAYNRMSGGFQQPMAPMGMPQQHYTQQQVQQVFCVTHTPVAACNRVWSKIYPTFLGHIGVLFWVWN